VACGLPSKAENRNPKVAKVHEEGRLRWGSVKPQGTLVLDIFFFDRNVFVPQIKNCGDDYAKPQADKKKRAISGNIDQKDGNERRGDQQASRAFYANRHSRKHGAIVALRELLTKVRPRDIRCVPLRRYAMGGV